MKEYSQFEVKVDVCTKVALNDSWKARNVAENTNKIYYVLKGECEVEILCKKHRLSEGDILIIPKNHNHSFRHFNDNYITKYYIHANIKTDGIDIFDAINLPAQFNIGINEKVLDTFKQISEYYTGEEISHKIMTTAKTIELVSLLCNLSGVESQGTTLKNDMEKVMDYIRENVSRPISVDHLAGILHLNLNYFISVFKSYTGSTPKQYINSLKMKQVRNLIKNTDLSMKTIMESVGFDDYSHFSKFVKKHTGKTPTGIRNEN